MDELMVYGCSFSSWVTPTWVDILRFNNCYVIDMSRPGASMTEIFYKVMRNNLVKMNVVFQWPFSYRYFGFTNKGKWQNLSTHSDKNIDGDFVINYTNMLRDIIIDTTNKQEGNACNLYMQSDRNYMHSQHIISRTLKFDFNEGYKFKGLKDSSRFINGNDGHYNLLMHLKIAKRIIKYFDFTPLSLEKKSIIVETHYKLKSNNYTSENELEYDIRKIYGRTA